MAITLDYEYATETGIGQRGISDAELQEAVDTFRALYRELQEDKGTDRLGFTMLPYQDEETLRAITDLADWVRSEVKDLVVVGIGGSDLGTRAVHRALNHQFYNLHERFRGGAPRLFFVGDTTDPVALQETLDALDLSSTAVTVISKSGNTVEQMSTFLYLRSRLIEAVGEETARERIILVTDPETGTLRDMVREQGYKSLPVPPSVGGRFSVLSSVGLFPLAVAGVDIRALLEGAGAMDRHDGEAGAQNSLPFLYAIQQYLFYRRGQHVSVLMPYSYSLREVGFWFRQLWAESLGKRLDLAGNEVEVGPTPVAALGPTDQHSQMQLYMEGPTDKVLTFLSVGETASDLEVPASAESAVSYLGGHGFFEILEAERRSSAYALASSGRPSLSLTMDRLDARSLGELLYFFELATAYAGSFLGIDAFDQPGVELGKKYMYGLLGREGFVEEFKVPDPSGHFSRSSAV